MRPNRRPSVRAVRLVRALLSVVVLVLAEPGVAAAASPGPSVSAAPSQVPEPGVAVWLDEPLPASMAAGTTVDVAFVLWDERALATVHDATPFIRLRSEASPPEPADAVARETSPGHFAASLVVPSGAQPIRLEVGFPGMTCAPQGGACQDVQFVFAIGGVGPPPGARLNTLARASIERLAAVTAGREVDVRVRLDLVGPWAPEDVDVPGQLFLLVRESRDADRAIAVGSDPDAPLVFDGSAVFDAPGDYDVDVSTEPQRSAASVFPGSAIKVHVTEGSLVEIGGAPPFVPIAAGAILVVALVLLGRRLLADL